jgi:hypothetical protein
MNKLFVVSFLILTLAVGLSAQNQAQSKQLSIQVQVTAHKATLNWTAAFCNITCSNGSTGTCANGASFTCPDGKVVPCAFQYRVYRGTVSGGPYTLLTPTATTLYVDQTVQSGQKYFYVVTSYNSTQESGYSNEVSALIPTP